MAKVQFDKKQMPAVLAMGVLSAGLFGFFVWKMTSPPPLDAAPKPGTPVATAAATKPDALAASTTASANPNSPASSPTLDLRDPFVPAITDDSGMPSKPFQVASSQTTEPGEVPTVPGLPPVAGDVHPLAPPSGSAFLKGADAGPKADWTVTGVISEPTDPRNRVAILRAGEVRRFVRLGDMVDSDVRLVGVSRAGVTLSAGGHVFHLPLGGGDTKKAKPAAGAAGGAAQTQLVPTVPLVPNSTAPAAATPAAPTSTAPTSATPAGQPDTTSP